MKSNLVTRRNTTTEAGHKMNKSWIIVTIAAMAIIHSLEGTTYKAIATNTHFGIVVVKQGPATAVAIGAGSRAEAFCDDFSRATATAASNGRSKARAVATVEGTGNAVATATSWGDATATAIATVSGAAKGDREAVATATARDAGEAEAEAVVEASFGGLPEVGIDTRYGAGTIAALARGSSRANATANAE